jgi:DNA-directed RNA polymerase specialized sigma24 family protein
MRLLVRITINKALDFINDEKGPGGRPVGGDSALGEAGFEPHAGKEPPPYFQAQVADLMAKLPSDELREIARLSMEGYTNAEVASRLGCCLSTVELKRSLIRRYWQADWAELRGEA